MNSCPQDQALYEEQIKTIVLRDSDGITIPKSVREEAFVLAVDIIIVSVPREVYKNYTTTPAEGFYGNATLVMQDCLERKIPVSMPRQRLYYGRVPEAFIFWQSMVDWNYFQWHMDAVGETIANLGAALGLGVSGTAICCGLPDRSWIELPLREVYFKCPKGTQYKIEVSWERALPIEDYCGNARTPKSRRDDGDKDNGLPPNGVQPNTAEDPDNPFDGLPDPTPNSEQEGFSNSKGESPTNNPSPLDNPDPDNEPTSEDPEGTLYWIVITSKVRRPNFTGGCANQRTDVSYILALKESEVVSIDSWGSDPFGCPSGTAQRKWNLTLTGGQPFNIGYSDETPVATKGKGLTLPTDTSTFDF